MTYWQNSGSILTCISTCIFKTIKIYHLLIEYSSTSASAQPCTTASAASGVLAAAAALPAALLHAASSGLAALAAYASGSEDEGENHAAPAIDVEAAALIAEEQRVQELRTKWTQEVFKPQKARFSCQLR
jgi:hypothetical protein